MALTNCPECGTQISDKAMVCPTCGNPVGQRRMLRRMIVFQAIVLIVVALFIISLFSVVGIF